MLDTTNSLGNALEFYFVDTLEDGSFGGVRCPEGIVMARDGTAVTVAHETLHDCGTEDIYTVEDQGAPDPNPVSGPVMRDRLPADWGGGYYPSDLTQRMLVARLIMRSGGEGADNLVAGLDLPGGAVYGWKHTSGSGASPKTLGQAGVGQSAIQRNPGSY